MATKRPDTKEAALRLAAKYNNAKRKKMPFIWDFINLRKGSV
jgi:hypothetical protein